MLEGHGWGGSRDTDENSASSEQTGNVGVGPLRQAGFNVLTWDARGFGSSGGTVTVDSPDAEARDVSALIDWLAKQPEAQLDGPDDPRVGMTGVSYAGGIELVTAPRDRRIDAIAPIIAWHSLLTSLYKEEIVKGGWSSLLYADGVRGLAQPAGPAHRLGVHQRRVLGAPVGRRRGLVRLARAGRRGGRDPDPDVPGRGHGGHAVHAARGDRELRDPARPRRAHEDDVVLRRARRRA